jgi:hypothetical protein
LQQHHADQRDNQHKMDDNNNRQHSGISVSPVLRGCETTDPNTHGCHIGGCAGLYTIWGGFSMAL